MHFILLLASIFLGSYPNVSFALDSAMGAIKALTGEDLNQLTGLDTYNLNMGGWLTPGFTFNPSNPSDRSNGPVQQPRQRTTTLSTRFICRKTFKTRNAILASWRSF